MTAPLKVYRVLITASRTWPDWHGLRKAMLAQVTHAYRSDYDAVVFVHGGAIGGDTFCEQYVQIMKGFGWPVDSEVHSVTKAEWSEFGGRAGHMRNERMVAKGADICLAFLERCTRPRCDRPKPHDTHGTAGCVKAAQRAGIEVVEHRPAGVTV